MKYQAPATNSLAICYATPLKAALASALACIGTGLMAL